MSVKKDTSGALTLEEIVNGFKESPDITEAPETQKDTIIRTFKKGDAGFDEIEKIIFSSIGTPKRLTTTACLNMTAYPEACNGYVATNSLTPDKTKAYKKAYESIIECIKKIDGDPDIAPLAPDYAANYSCPSFDHVIQSTFVSYLGKDGKYKPTLKDVTLAYTKPKPKESEYVILAGKDGNAIVKALVTPETGKNRNGNHVFLEYLFQFSNYKFNECLGNLANRIEEYVDSFDYRREDASSLTLKQVQGELLDIIKKSVEESKTIADDLIKAN